MKNTDIAHWPVLSVGQMCCLIKRELSFYNVVVRLRWHVAVINGVFHLSFYIFFFVDFYLDLKSLCCGHGDTGPRHTRNDIELQYNFDSSNAEVYIIVSYMYMLK